MSPVEKAKEIVDKYRTFVVMWSGGVEVENANVKACAIIAVDLLLDQLDEIRKPEYTSFIKPAGENDPIEVMDGYEKMEYWNQVKQEIGKL